MCAAFFFFNYGVTIMSYLTAMIYHELAHSVTAERRGYKLNKFKLMPYGASVSGDYYCVKPNDEFFIALAGPLSNFAVAIIGWAMWWQFPVIYPFTEPLVMSSLFLGLTNLLPVFPLDGGRMLLALLNKKFSQKTSYRAVKIISIITGAVFAAVSIVMMFFGGNFSYITLTVFMLVSAVLPDDEVKYQRLYSMAYSSERLKRGLTVKEIMVCDEKTLLDLSKMLSGSHYTRFLIVSGDFKQYKTITETQLEEKMMTNNPAEKVKSVDF